MFHRTGSELRRLTECFIILVGSTMFCAAGYTCQTIILFGTLKDSSLKINSLPLNNRFSYRNVLQNGVNALFFKKESFFQKPQNFVHFGLFDLFQIAPACDF